MSDEERANLVRQCIMKLHDKGIQTMSLTCDGTSCQFKIMEKLGASLKANIDCALLHTPGTLLDISPMLKLTRNTLAHGSIIVDQNGDKIRWSYIEKLHKLQKEEGLRLGNKLKVCAHDVAKAKNESEHSCTDTKL
jgi:hypothetical protein